MTPKEFAAVVTIVIGINVAAIVLIAVLTKWVLS